MIYDLRLRDRLQDNPLFHTGDFHSCDQYASAKGYFWVKDLTVFGGRFTNRQTGNVLFLTLKAGVKMTMPPLTLPLGLQERNGLIGYQLQEYEEQDMGYNPVLRRRSRGMMPSDIVWQLFSKHFDDPMMELAGYRPSSFHKDCTEAWYWGKSNGADIIVWVLFSYEGERKY